MNFAIYMIGVLLVTGAVAYAASRIGLSSTWILVISLLIIGLGLMGGVVKTRRRDPNN
jgi:hypothetical protein